MVDGQTECQPSTSIGVWSPYSARHVQMKRSQFLWRIHLSSLRSVPLSIHLSRIAQAAWYILDLSWQCHRDILHVDGCQQHPRIASNFPRHAPRKDNDRPTVESVSWNPPWQTPCTASIGWTALSCRLKASSVILAIPANTSKPESERTRPGEMVERNRQRPRNDIASTQGISNIEDTVVLNIISARRARRLNASSSSGYSQQEILNVQSECSIMQRQQAQQQQGRSKINVEEKNWGSWDDRDTDSQGTKPRIPKHPRLKKINRNWFFPIDIDFSFFFNRNLKFSIEISCLETIRNDDQKSIDFFKQIKLSKENHLKINRNFNRKLPQNHPKTIEICTCQTTIGLSNPKWF